jgi:hypothetical protein
MVIRFPVEAKGDPSHMKTQRLSLAGNGPSGIRHYPGRQGFAGLQGDTQLNLLPGDALIPGLR